mgnify:CR=1 FL=1
MQLFPLSQIMGNNIHKRNKIDIIKMIIKKIMFIKNLKDKEENLHLHIYF